MLPPKVGAGGRGRRRGCYRPTWGAGEADLSLPGRESRGAPPAWRGGRKKCQCVGSFMLEHFM